MINGLTIALIIPALNEEKSIAYVLKEIPAQIDQIIVVDNGSSDNTARIAQNLGARVVNEHRRGYGSACLTGIKAAKNYDIIAFMDADYSDYPEDIINVLQPICLHNAEFVVGSRHESDLQKPVLTRLQRVGNHLVCRLMHQFIGFYYTDLGPMRAIVAKQLRQLNMSDQDYGWTIEMQIKAVHHGLKIREIPVRYRARIGKSKISGTIKGSLLAGYKILIWTFRSRMFHIN